MSNDDGDDFANLVTIRDWFEANKGAVFPSLSSVQWFIKMNRDELVRMGAYLPREGRSGSLINRKVFPSAVVEIWKRKAIGQTSTELEKAVANLHNGANTDE